MNDFPQDQRFVATRPFFNEQLSCRVVLFLLTTFAMTAKLGCSVKPVPRGRESQEVSLEKKSGIVFEQSRDRVNILVNGEPFTSYYFLGYKKPIFFPLRSASGRVVTRGYPMVDDVPGESRDHPHHTGVWFAHGDVNGIDFWSESSGSGSIKHRKFHRVESGPKIGVLESSNDWISLSGDRILTEIREVRVYSRYRVRVMDLTFQLIASDGAVTFGDTKEGTFGMRLAQSFTEKAGLVIQNSQGSKGEAECWGKPARWVDYSTRIDRDFLGVAILDHPQSFRHPTHWHARGYSLFAANPFGLHDFYNDDKKDGRYVLSQGQSIQFRYRVYIYSGNAGQARIEKEYNAFEESLTK